MMNVKKGGFRLLGNKNGLLNEHIYGMLPDTRGNLWISSNQGLFLLDIRKEKFRHFAAVSGLQSNEFNSGAFCKGRSGKIYFGGIHGINWFEPEHFYAKPEEPLAVLSGLFVNGSRHMKSAAELNYDQNDLRFNFSAIDFSSPQGNKIRYILKGWDDKPVFTESREAIYNNLTPGTYRMEYEACNARGVWSKLNSYSFTIHPPFWKTIWFYLFSGASGLTLLIFCIRYYEKRKLAEQLRKAEQQRLLSEERLRISSEMHDDIGAGLTRISLMTQAARKEIGSREELIEDIGQTSRKLVESMGEIIWSMSEESRSPEQVLAYIREMVSKQLEYSTICPEFRFGLDNKAILLSNHQKRSLILMVKELVNNAIKYSGADSIRIDISIENSGLSVEVKDNGCGFSGEIQGSGSGLKNLKSKVEKLGGTFHIGNERGAWVRICIALN
jgi:signal transduction histidine kinase